MPDASTLTGYLIVILGLAITPGPNMIYLISRSIAQGRAAGIISLGGSTLGFFVYMAFAAFGITALLMAVPFAFDTLRLAEAIYLMFLAWQSVQPSGRSPFQVDRIQSIGQCKAFAMSFVTTLLNPKAALRFCSSAAIRSAWTRKRPYSDDYPRNEPRAVNLTFGVLIAGPASGLATGLAKRPKWLLAQRWSMGSLLATFSVKSVSEA